MDKKELGHNDGQNNMNKASPASPIEDGKAIDRRKFLEAIRNATCMAVVGGVTTWQICNSLKTFESIDLFANIIDDLERHLEEKSRYRIVDKIPAPNSRGTIVIIETPLLQRELSDDEKAMLDQTYTEPPFLRGIPAQSIVFLREKAGLDTIYTVPSDPEVQLRKIIDTIKTTEHEIEKSWKRNDLVESCGNDLAGLLDPSIPNPHVSLQSILCFSGDTDVQTGKRVANRHRCRRTACELDEQRRFIEEFLNKIRKENMGNICILTEDSRLLKEVIIGQNTCHPGKQFSIAIVRNRLNTPVALPPLK